MTVFFDAPSSSPVDFLGLPLPCIKPKRCLNSLDSFMASFRADWKDWGLLWEAKASKCLCLKSRKAA